MISPEVFRDFFYFFFSVLAPKHDTKKMSYGNKNRRKERRKSLVSTTSSLRRLPLLPLSSATVSVSLRHDVFTQDTGEELGGSESEAEGAKQKKWGFSLFGPIRKRVQRWGAGLCCSHVSGVCSEESCGQRVVETEKELHLLFFKDFKLLLISSKKINPKVPETSPIVDKMKLCFCI